MDDDGYVFLVDRAKDLIISSGYNIYPRNVEEAIYLHPAVAEAVVIGVPDAYRGQAVKAFVALRPGAVLTADDLKNFLKDKLSPMEAPRAIEFRPSLPKTMVGKLSKKELVAEELAKHQAATAEGRDPDSKEINT
jgi:long-chain acyl-CoA synthetase